MTDAPAETGTDADPDPAAETGSAADPRTAESAADPTDPRTAESAADPTDPRTAESAADPTDSRTAESAETGVDSGASGDESTYSGLFSAFPYAFRVSESRLFKSYAVLGGLAALLVAVVFAAALVNLMGETASATGGTFTFSRAFFVALMLVVFGPLVAPVLLVARRHRRGGSDRRYDRGLAAAGYLFFLGVYAALGISVPPALREDSPGAVGSFLYSLPTEAAAVPPVVAVLAVYLAHRYYR